MLSVLLHITEPNRHALFIGLICRYRQEVLIGRKQPLVMQ